MKNAIYILMFFLLFAFVGCKKEQPVNKPKAEKVRQVEAKNLQKPAAETKKVVPEEVIYEGKGKDPFLSPIGITKEKPVKKRGASPFESYDIGEIKFLAIAW